MGCMFRGIYSIYQPKRISGKVIELAKKKNTQQVDINHMKAVDDEHATLIGWVNSADDLTVDARTLSEKCRDYYDSKQLSADEIATLKKRKQAPVVINRIKPKLDSLMGMEKAAKTTAKAFPRTPKHEKAAEAASESIRFVLQDNDFGQIRSQTWEHMAIEGTGGCEIIVKPSKKDKNSFRVTLNPIMWDRLIFDPHSRRKEFKDARFLGQVVWQDYDEALAENPDSKDVLESLIDGSSTYDDKPRWVDGTRRRVKIVELYYQKKGEWYYACFTRGGYIKEPMRSPYKNEEGESEHAYEFQSAFVDRDGGRYGATRQLLDVQDEINKRRSKALHLMSVRQVMTERGAVEDLNKARQELAKPDGIVEVTPGMLFEVLKTGDMAAAQFNLLTEAKMEIDNVGTNAATQGKDKSIQSGVALRERQAAGQTEIGPMFDGLRYWQQRVFRKVYNRIRQYWKGEMWIRVTDDENNLRWVGLNKPVTRGEQMMKQAQEQAAGMPPEQLAQMMAQLQAQIAADPMAKEVVETENELADLDVDIIVSEVPDVLTAQIEDFQVLGEMVKSGFQMPPLAVIEASPLSNKDKIIKMMKEAPQIPPQMAKQMEQLQEQAQKLAQENQALKSGQQEAAAKLQVSAQESQQKIAAKREETLADIQLRREIAAEERALAREEAMEKLALEREVASAKLEIEGVQIAAKHENENKKMAMDHENENKKMDMEQERDSKAEAAKRDEKVKTEEVAAVPNFTKAIEQITKAFAQALEGQQKHMEKMVEALREPKTVKLGGIQRGDSGITGATATIQ